MDRIIVIFHVCLIEKDEEEVKLDIGGTLLRGTHEKGREEKSNLASAPVIIFTWKASQ